MEEKQKKKAYLYLTLTMVIWGSMYVFCKYVFLVMPPMAFLFFRYVLGTGVLYLIYRRGKQEKIARGDWKYIAGIGVVGYYLGIGFQMIGTELCPASLAALINSMNPVVIILLAMVILKERATAKKLLAVGVTVVGTVVIIGQVEGDQVFWGAIISIAGVIAWSYSSVIVRAISGKYNSTTITLYSMCLATVLALPTCIVDLARTPLVWENAGFLFVFSFLYIGIVSTVVSFLLWNKGLALVDAATCSLFYPIQPVVSSVMGILILHEIITVNFVVGTALIVAGILFCVISEGKAGSGKTAV